MALRQACKLDMVLGIATKDRGLNLLWCQVGHPELRDEVISINCRHRQLSMEAVPTCVSVLTIATAHPPLAGERRPAVQDSPVVEDYQLMVSTINDRVKSGCRNELNTRPGFN